MTWKSRYHPPTTTLWTGRSDSPEQSCVFQVMRLLNLTKKIQFNDSSNISFGFLGFCCDEGVKRNLGRIGASEGPFAIREALAPLTIQRKNIICYDAGDIICPDDDLENSQHALAEAVMLLLEYGITPIILGGGHELAWGHYQGLKKYLTNKSIGIINFDAHFDMRPLLEHKKGTSGTAFLQIAKDYEHAHHHFQYSCIGIQRGSNTHELFESAKKYRTKIFLADDLYQDVQPCINSMNDLICHSQHIYLSLCLDVFASAYAPGVSAPQALGLTPWQVIPLVKMIASSGKVMSYDIAELAPLYDADQRTAKLAAHLIYEIIHSHAKES